MQGQTGVLQMTPEARKAFRTAPLPLPVILFLLAVVLPITFNVGPLLLTTLRLFLLAMVLPMSVMLLTGRHGRIYATDVLFVLYFLWGAVALLVNNPNQMVQQMGSVGVEFIGGYLVGRIYIRSALDFVALCRWLTMLVCFSLPFAVFETLTTRPVLLEMIRALPGIFAVDTVVMPERLGLDRVQFTFAHPIHYGLFCSIVFALRFVAMKGVTSTTWRWTLSLLIAGAGFLALSSGALLAIMLQIALILWASVLAGVKQRWWILVGLFALGYVVVDILSNRTPITVFMSYATFSPHNAYMRGLIFEWGMKNIWAHPVFGLGMNDWVRPAFMHSSSVDNFWLLTAMRYGIPGFLLLVIGYVLVVFHVMRRNFDGDVMLAQIRRAWVFTFLGLSFTLCTVHVWTNVYSFVIFLLGAGVWLITATSSTAPSGSALTIERRGPGPEGAARSGTSPRGIPAPRPVPDAGPDPQTEASPYTRFRPRHMRGASPRPRGD